MNRPTVRAGSGSGSDAGSGSGSGSGGGVGSGVDCGKGSGSADSGSGSGSGSGSDAGSGSGSDAAASGSSAASGSGSGPGSGSRDGSISSRSLVIGQYTTGAASVERIRPRMTTIATTIIATRANLVPGITPLPVVLELERDRLVELPKPAR